jgi:hypothetical protein
MRFLDTLTPVGAAPVWATLDTKQRAEVVAALGRLIAEMAAPSNQEPTAAEEKPDE